jgi:hypothetical protein
MAKEEDALVSFDSFPVPAVGRRRSQRVNGYNDPQPSVGDLSVASLAHPLDHFPRLRHGIIAMLRDPLMSSAVNVEIGDAPQHWGEAERGSPARRLPGMPPCYARA